MAETKHTPGPWQAGRADMGTVVDGVTSKWIYAGDQYVAVASGRIEGEWDEVIANANLIAAAPEMLNALKQAILQLEYLDEKFPTGTTPAVLGTARRAIAKAEGR